VKLFTEYRVSMGEREIHHTRLWRWAKSFRIMLAHEKYRYSFDDLKLVVTSLKSREDHMDIRRTHDAYDLSRDGEWEHVLAGVHHVVEIKRILAERKKAHPAPTPRPGWDFDDDAYIPRYREDDGGEQRSDMSNISERRRRYAAGGNL
jgi:hypothetical protein